MARRMFSPDIVESEEFLSLPISSQALYFHLGMNADDDGFIQPLKIMRMVGSTNDDLKILVGRRFLLTFENGVVVIKHWLIHNLIRGDRYKETRFIEQKNLLKVKENKAYTELNKLGCQDDNQRVSQVRLGKVRLGKVRLGKVREDNTSEETSQTYKKFNEPTLEDVTQYCEERKNNIKPSKFIDFYSSKGWYVGKNKMKDWKACVRTWEGNSFDKKQDTLKVATGKYSNIKTIIINNDNTKKV